MEVTGTIKGLSNDLITGELLITLSVNEKDLVVEEYPKLKLFQKLKIKIDKFREGRSKDANAYMWVLLQKMSIVLNTSKDELYLDMLGEYGVFTHIIAKPKAVDRVKKEFKTVRDLGEVTVNGNTGIQLQVYYGSSTYDTLEMSNLINGVVNKCIDLGIQTLPPDELRQMKERWGV